MFLTQEEFARLFDLVPEWYRPLVLFLVGTGVRFGEATALRVMDVQLDGDALAGRRRPSAHVRQSWKHTRRSSKELAPPKTRRSERTVAVPAAVADAVAPLLAGKQPGSFVFVNHRGGEVKQATFWLRAWHPAVTMFAGDLVRLDRDKDGRKVLVVEREGPGKHPRIHDLRHTFASWAIQSGVPLPVIQRQLGHESITTTIDTYGHLARADFDVLAEATAACLPQLPPSLGRV